LNRDHDEYPNTGAGAGPVRNLLGGGRAPAGWFSVTRLAGHPVPGAIQQHSGWRL